MPLIECLWIAAIVLFAPTVLFLDWLFLGGGLFKILEWRRKQREK